MSQSARPTYSEQQIQRYLEYVGQQRRIPKESCDSQEGLKYLNELVKRQLATVPFENLDLHYSAHHTASINTEYLFNKVVDRKMGRGGYCMQNNLLFSTVLRSLGYKTMPCGSRVSSAVQGVPPEHATYGGWSHTVNMIMISGQKYFTDVGFGAECPSLAVPMINGWTSRSSWVDYDNMRLDREHIADNTFTNEEQKLWVYKVKRGADGPWTPMYCFAEVEFLPQDFTVSNFYVSKNIDSFFTRVLMCSKGVLDERGEYVGAITVFDTKFKKTVKGESEVLAEVATEQDRVEAFEMYMGIKLDSVEVAGMQGHVSMLGG